jgi:tetratricopeptide (TPR) repeat protein
VARQAGEDYFAVDAAHMMGIVEPPAQALEWHLKALALAEASGEERAKGWLGPLYNNLGWTYFQQKEYARSLDLLRKALAWYEAKKLPEQIRIAKWSVAKLLRVHGKLEEALRTQEALHREREQLGKPDGYVFEELGECLQALDRSQEARPHFARAHELLSKDEWLVRTEPKRIERLKTLGGQ